MKDAALAVGHDDLVAVHMDFVTGFDVDALEFDVGVKAFPGVFYFDPARYVDRLPGQPEVFDHVGPLP
jgi:hypothetical protein